MRVKNSTGAARSACFSARSASSTSRKKPGRMRAPLIVAPRSP
jgi:hypothetical protein